jgi:RNA polymerase sigma-70 factor (ECF subfamily)
MSSTDRHSVSDAQKQIAREEELVASLKQRNREAVGTLYDRYASPLYGVILRIIRSEELAEDLLQETFVRVWRNIDSYDRSKGRLFTWLINIARNLALDTIKSRSFRDAQQNQEIDNIVNVIDARENASYNPEHIGLRELLDRLTPEHREVVELIYFEGYTHTEAAEQLSLPLGTLKTRLRAAINFFRKILT